MIPILDWIFEGIVGWVASIVSQLFDAVSGLFLEALGTDMTAMEEYFPFVTKAYDVMQVTAWAILILITVWQLFRAFGGPITEAENPWHLVVRGAIFAFLIGYAKPIFSACLSIARAPYTSLMDLSMTGEDFTFAGVEQALTSGLTTIVSVASVVGLILILILEIALGWNYFKLLLETVERYIVVGVLCYTSPLAFSLGGSKATNNTLTSIPGGQPSRVVLLSLFQKGNTHMIINRIGAKYHYNGVTYTVGDQIIANAESEYEGLFGTITEIRDGNDRETENDTPDIHCEFMPPFDAGEIKALENRFSCLYRQEKKLEDIILDYVIMAPEMITIMTPAHETRKFPVYEIREEWISDDDAGVSIEYAFDETMAKRYLTQMVNEEKSGGLVPGWIDKPEFRVDSTPLYYEAWLDGEYCGNHYKAFLTRHELCMSHELFEAIGKTYVDMLLRKHFAEQIEDWEELEDMTEDQIAQMIASPKVPQRIRKQLEQNSSLIEFYWESVSEASFALVKKFKEGTL